MDGIDVALLETDGYFQLNSRACCFFPYQEIFTHLLKSAEYCAQQLKGNLDEMNHVWLQCWQEYLQNALHLDEETRKKKQHEANQYIAQLFNEPWQKASLAQIIRASTELHAKAIKEILQQNNLNPNDIDLIGYHGQTLYHAPEKKISLQVGNGQYLADLCRIPVIYQFRQKDIATGGQGAPFAPLYHQALLVSDRLIPSAVINCGGIANITYVLGETFADVIAFDTGPGNVLLDRFVRQKTKGQALIDEHGQYALQGQALPEALALLEESALPQGFIEQAPPKSLDSSHCQLPPDFQKVNLPDGCATLAYFTAKTIVASLDTLEKYYPTRSLPKYWILAGGGWHHPFLLASFENLLKQRLPQDINIVTAKQLGWQHDALEAEAFAYLAARSYLNLPLSLPNTTGVPTPTIGGKLVLPR